MGPKRDYRVSPDGESIAIRSDYPEDAFNAYGVMHCRNGGHWATATEVADWAEVTAPPVADPAE